ncbi:E3 ubiquitin-protein ligase MARCH2 isoform X2 [Cephus cinctus]|uniref:E3 ubiquitin-protein ligase MARCH2 isoform X2 n=1 Tax=Cephus cinctus TaxID=211228 RepID=A0AAJ7FTC7_CEPCN|nr:E3 ubiquitin-protein ligase MARCH2 isoform X2 [Cephus cinctus]
MVHLGSADGSSEELVDPCKCSGTLALVHTGCLEKWLSTSNKNRCEICKYPYVLQRTNKSFSEWWSSRNAYGPQGIAGDFICLMVLTPLCVAATYLCGIGANAYSRLGFWEGTGLAILCFMLVATYSLWLIVTIRFHFKSWRQWRQRNQDVKLLVKHKMADGLESKYLDNNIKEEEVRINTLERLSTIFRLISWLGLPFGYTNDPSFDVQQHASLV